MGFFFRPEGGGVSIAGFRPEGGGVRLQGFRRTSDSCILDWTCGSQFIDLLALNHQSMKSIKNDLMDSNKSIDRKCGRQYID